MSVACWNWTASPPITANSTLGHSCILECIICFSQWQLRSCTLVASGNHQHIRPRSYHDLLIPNMIPEHGCGSHYILKLEANDFPAGWHKANNEAAGVEKITEE